jgi:hypothetical protein
MNILKTISKTSIIVVSIFALTLVYSSCKKKVTTPPNPNEEELITTVLLHFTDSAGVHPSVTSIYKDVDGDGGNNPSQWDTIKLKANTTYYAEILLLDESKSPSDTISQEVLEEAKDHLFCFTPTNVNVSVKRTDFDINNLEIGLHSNWYTGVSASGSMQVVLRHQPGIKTGACALGSSDVDITFQCKIE